ncbi:MAG: FKBP-type peptidyl-prolyl cis-trans isomerase [Candidatus Berkiellales bacterium]
MRLTLVAALTAMSLCCLSDFALGADKKVTQLKDKKDKISYSIGVDIGKSIQQKDIAINMDTFIAGFKDGQAGKLTKMTEDDVRQTLVALQAEIIEKQKSAQQAQSGKNLADGEKFLTDNKKQKGVVALPSGLQYRIISEGKGDSPTLNDTVTAQYRGKLINGTEFDSSYSHGGPVKFEVKNVIPGWTEALQLMKPGAKWELFIPPKLAYGQQSIGQVIGPNSTLIFEVELITVEKQTAKANAKPGDKTAQSNGNK